MAFSATSFTRLLTVLLLLLSCGVWAQTPYPLASGTYTENFSQISGWGNLFDSGTGAAPFSVAAASPTLPNQNGVFSTGTSGGVQKGTQAIVLLATGNDNANAAAFDLNLDFTGTTAGTVSLDWAQVNNSGGNRQSTFKLQTNTGTGGAFVDLPGSSLVLTNFASPVASGQLMNLALPAGFTNNATARIRFYIQPTAGGASPSGSRPKISLDNLTITATTNGPVTPTITSGAISGSPFCVTATTGAAVAVPYTVTGGLTGTFAAQLSNASGQFATDLTQNLIGSGTSSPLAATLPAGTTAGSGYRVRVVHGASATAGQPSVTDLRIDTPPATNPVTITPAAAQSITTTGTGAALTASPQVPSSFAWLYSTSSAGPFTTAISGATAASYTPRGVDFGAVGTYYLVARATSTCGSIVGTSAPVTISVTTPTPVVNATPNPVPDFGSLAVGTASPARSVSLSGSSLPGNVTLTPPAGFQLRSGTTAFSCAPLTLPVSGGTLTASIEVRFVPEVAQAYNGVIALTSPGAAQLDGIAVSGTGQAAFYPPSLHTTAVTEVTAATATSGGTVLEDGGSVITARGVVFATTPAPTTQDELTSDGTGSGPFVSALTDLLANTTYYVRAYATNAQGTSYGEQRSFTTTTIVRATEPTQGSTLTVTALAPTTLTLGISGGNGQRQLLLLTQGPAVTFQPQDGTTYAANTTFGQGDQPAAGTYVALAAGATSVTITGLAADTEYSFAVYDYNDDNTSGAENYLLAPFGELTLSTPAQPAGLLLTEDFDYPAGERLTAHGWTAHSSGGTNAILLATPGLGYASYTGTPASGNRPGAANAAAALTGSGEDVSRTFPSQTAGSAVYASLLVNVSASSGADYFFHFGPDPISTTFRARVFVRPGATSGQVQFGVSGSGTTTVYAPGEYALNTPHLLVLRYVFGPSGTETRLYVNPGASEPATADARNTEAATSAPANLGSVALRQGGTSAPLVLVDGLRVATAYEPARAFAAPLPVTLTSFTAQRASGRVQLQWTTAQELNARLFRVQRSVDGRTFTPVLTEAAGGTTNQARRYSAQDVNAPAGLLYYRLEQEDTDGRRQYSAVVTVSGSATSDASLRVAPNPADASQPLSLQVQGRAGQALTLQVLDNAGRVLHTQALRPLTGTEQLPLRLPGTMPVGTYLLRVSGAGVAPLHTRLVLTR